MPDSAPPLLLLRDVPLGGRRLQVRLGPGDRFADHAPNGAGKSTLIRAIAGLAPIRQGEIRVGGSPPGSPNARRLVGFVPDRPVHPAWPCGALMAMVADLVGVAPDRDLLLALGLRPDHVASTLSHGESRRLALALALAARPRLLLWDEPWTALDAEGREAAARVVEHANEGGTAIFALAPDPEGLGGLTGGSPP